MKYTISDEKVKLILDELGEEYKELLVERVLENSQEIDVDQINPSDLIRLDVSTKARLRENRRDYQRNRILYLASSLGIIYALLGLILLLIGGYQTDIQDSSVILMSCVLISLGLLTTLVTTLYRTVFRSKSPIFPNRQKDISPYEVVDKWKEIEALIIQLNPNKDRMSLHAMINQLIDNGILSEGDSKTINELLLARTAIVHTRKVDLVMSTTDLRSRLIEAEMIISKLHKLI